MLPSLPLSFWFSRKVSKVTFEDSEAIVCRNPIRQAIRHIPGHARIEPGKDIVLRVRDDVTKRNCQAAIASHAFDVLDCPQCGGRLRLLATITQREVVERILSHLGLPIEPELPEPAQSQEDLFS